MLPGIEEIETGVGVSPFQPGETNKLRQDQTGRKGGDEQDAEELEAHS